MRKSLLAGACITAMWSFIAAPALAVTVTNVEVTQAIQTPTNTVKLIARRSTAVRATLATGGGAVANVTGSLHVIRDGVDVTPAGIAPINAPMTAPAAPQRERERHAQLRVDRGDRHVGPHAVHQHGLPRGRHAGARLRLNVGADVCRRPDAVGVLHAHQVHAGRDGARAAQLHRPRVG